MCTSLGVTKSVRMLSCKNTVYPLFGDYELQHIKFGNHCVVLQNKTRLVDLGESFGL